MNYAVEMGCCAMIYISGFIKIGSAFQKLMSGGCAHTDTNTHTHTEHGDLISLLLFLQNRKVG
jgi:hypothetical protein